MFCKGDIPYKDIGCFADKGGKERPLSEMLFSDEAKRRSESWEEFLPDVICACAKAAREKKYAYFGIQNFAECWSGPRSKETYMMDGKDVKCISTVPKESTNTLAAPMEKFETCINNSLVCAGKQGANYVYGLEDGKY